MNAQPSLQDLIAAARIHMEGQVVPAVRADRKLYFQTLVAINVLKIAEREILLGPRCVAEAWQRLNVLEGSDAPPPSDLSERQAQLQVRRAALCEAIRSGSYDAEAAVLLEVLIADLRDQLSIDNPRFLAGLDAEDNADH